MTDFIRSPLSESITRAGIEGKTRFPIPAALLLSAPAWGANVAHDIRADAGFTDVATNGTVHDITSKKRAGAHAINVFDKFVVGTNHTANLQVPNDLAAGGKLVNIVRGSDAAAVHGVLNSEQNGQLGGDVVFASSAGFLVGSSGVVNVGSLSIKTPSQNDLDNLISNGEADSSKVSDLLNNSFSVSSSGTVTIQGKINAASGVNINANQIDITDTGKIISRATYGASGVVSAAAVNVDDLTIPTQLQVSGGTIVLKAASSGDNAINLSGDLYADGGFTITANDIALNDGSTLDARNTDDSARGDIVITASASQSVGIGAATVSTGVDLSGTIHADDLTVTAKSIAKSSFYEEPGTAIGQVTSGALAGASFYLMDADADATVNVNSTANIAASGDVTLASEAHAITDASALTLGNALPAALAAVYATSDATSTTHVKNGATIDAEGALEVTAHNEAFVSATAFEVIATDSNQLAVAAAVGESDVNATAKIDSGVSLDADNLVLAAENQNYYYVSATAYGLKNTRYGVAVAIGDFDTNATAELGSSLGTAQDKTGNINITALDRTLNQRVHSGVTVGDNALMRTLGSKPIQGLSALQNGVHSYTNKFLPVGQSVPTDDSGKVSFKGGLAFSLNLSDHDAYSFLGTNVSGQSAPAINSTGNILVYSQTDLGSDNARIAGGNTNGAAGGDQGGYRTSAEAAVSSPAQDNSGTGSTPQSEKSLALALNFGINDSDAVAEVGEFVEISTANLGVVAIQQMPIVSTYDQWDSFTSVASKFNGVGGLQNNLLTSFANAGASADEKAYGGALNVLVNDMDTKAWIGDGASITTTGTGNWSASRQVKGNSTVPGLFSNFNAFKNIDYTLNFTDSVTVKAYNLMETVSVAGNLGTLGLFPNGNGTNEKGKSVGGSITYVQHSGNAIAGIGKATVNSAGHVGIYAQTDERHFLVTPSSGQSSGMGFNGVLGFLNSEVISHASLHNQAQLSADQLIISAGHEFGNWAAAGAVNWSDESAVGIAIAANVSQGDTKAWIGDNSNDYSKVKFQDGSNNNISKPTPDSPTAPVPVKGIVANSVSVRGRASGTNGSLAVAGALTTEPSNEPGIGTKLENWYSGLSSKLSSNYSSANSSNGDSSVGGASASGANDDSGSGSGQSSANVSQAQTGMAAAGSFTVSVNNIDAKAIVEGASIRGHDIANSSEQSSVDVTVQALEKVISASATGSAAISLLGAQSPTNQNTIAGAISYQISFNDALAWLKDSVITNARDVSVQALHGGELTSVALALSVTKPDPTSAMTQNGALSISGAQIFDGTSARIEGSTITANGGNDDEVEVSAYNNSYVGVGGGTLYGGGKQGAGLAITFAEINDPSALIGSANPDDGNHFSPADGEDVYKGAATEAIIDYSGSTRSTLNDFDRVDVSARSLNRIGIGAAGVGYNNNQEDALGFQGSFAIGSIGADTKALVKGASITSALVNVDATGEKDGTLDKILSDLGSSNINSEFDFSGDGAIDNTNVHVSEDGSSSSYSYNSEGKRIIAVAGAVQVGKKNLGISYSHADVKSTTSARIEDTNINKASGTGAVNVNARDNTLLYNVAIGVGVGTGGFSGVGSVAVNRLNNTIVAEVGDWNGSDKGTINVDALSVNARNDMDMVNVSGAVAVAGGQGAANAGGLAVALNLVGTDEHSTKARISNTNLKVDGDLTVNAASGNSSNHNLLVGNAIAIGASTGQSGLAFAGAISVNNVDQSIEAGIKDTATNRSSSASSTAGANVAVQAQDYTDSVATAWMGAGSAQGSAFGVATATNRVDSDVTAEILGNSGNPGSTTLKAQNVFVDAHRRNWLLTIDAGVAASKQIAFAPSIGTGVIDGNVKARIADDAKVEAWNNVVVEASADSVNLVGSGALGIGIDGGAGALAVSTAVEYGKTEAFIDNAEVTAKGLGSARSTTTGQLSNQSDLPDLSASGEGSSSTVSMGALTTGFGTVDLSEKTEDVNGVIVNASSSQKQRAITVGGSGSKNVAITANVATTSVDSETTAYIKDSKINQSITPGDNADVLVRAGNQSFGLAISAGGSVTVGGESGGAGIGGFSTNRDSKDTLARIENSQVKADDITIDARASKVAQAVSAGVAAALGATSGLGGAASVVITEQNGNTRARLFGGSVVSDTLAVNAETRQEANVAAGSAGLGTSVGIGVGLAVNLVGGDTEARIGKDSSDNNNSGTTTVSVDDIDVDADRLVSVDSYAFGAGIGASSTGVAAMVNTSEITGETRATISGIYNNSNYTTKVRGKDGSSKATDIDVRSQEILHADQMTAGIGVGATVGVGAVANVLLGRSQAYSEVIGSDIKATSLDVHADTLREASLISVSGAGGQYSAAVSIGLVLMGQGDTTTDDGVNAEDEFGASRDMSNNALAVNYSDSNPHLDSDDENNLGGSGNVTASSSSTSADAVYTASGNRLQLSGESVTAARLSGGKIELDSLTVNSDARLHTYQGVGAAQVSAVGIAGGIGVTRLYDMSIATVDADVTADTIDVQGRVRNKSDDDAAAEMKNFIISAGGTAIGVAYSDVRSKHRVVAGLTQAVSSDTTNDSGTLNITAQDTTELRIGDTGSNVSSDPANGTLNVNIGAGAVGVSVGIAEKDSDVDAWLGAYDDKGTTATSDDVYTVVDGFSSQTVAAEVSGKVRSTAFAAAGGLLGGVQGVVTDARDTSNADAVVYGQIASGANGVLNVKASAVPETFSRAYGVTVAGGASVGGSFAYAKADTTANATVANRTDLFEGATVNVDAVTGKTDANYVSADATAFAASGGLLVGISGAEARATNNSDTTANIGDYVKLPVGDLNVSASNRSRQIGDADGYFVGLYSAGLTFSTAESQTSTRVLFGKDPVGPASRAGDIILLANSVDENQGFSTAGGGGYVSGSATVSNSHTKDSSTKESASVEVADWSSNYTSNQVGAGRVQMEANHQTFFFAGADSINVSVYGGSGARSDVEVDLDTSVDLGRNVSFYADEIDFSATNSVDQIGNPWYNSFEHSVKAGAGGAVNGSAALSDVDISHLGATVDIGTNAVLKIDPLADLLDPTHALKDYHIQMDAVTSYNIRDQVVLEVGGALQGAGAESTVNVNAVNTINLGQNVQLLNPLGQVELGTHSRGFASADASAAIWAAAGVAGGVTDVDLTTANSIVISDGVDIDSFESTKILAGRSADYLTDNYLSADARTNVYNWTAVPIPATKTADADVTVDSTISFGDNVSVSSVRDILLEADRGQTFANGDGVERNPYLELFSSETKFGSSNADKGRSKIEFDGSSALVAGTRYQQSVSIDAAGTISKGNGTEALAYNYGSFSSRDSLAAYIQGLKDERTALQNQTGGTDTGVGGIDDGGDTGQTSNGSSSTGNIAQSAPARVEQINEELAFLEPLLDTLPAASNSAIYIGDLFAAGGDVNLKADEVSVLSGSPSITAHGDPTITITNNSSRSLILGDMFIPDVGGGTVAVSGAVANNLPVGLTINENNSGNGSHINVQHKPSVNSGADVVLQGNLTNYGGVVTVNVEKGNLIQTGTVAAKQMSLSVPTGIYLLNNRYGTQSYGFSPESLAGFTRASGWKPASADKLVEYYVNAAYSSQMSSLGEEAFNEWWYGNNYYGNSQEKDSDLRVYLNWGFNNDAECKSGADCEIFSFDNKAGGGSRGNGNWGFNQIKNLQNGLVKTATYQQVKNAGFGDQGGYALQAQLVAVNAYRIDINGTIRAGNFNEWSVNIGSNFDAAMADYVAAKGLSSGSIVKLSPGQKLSWQVANPNYDGIFNRNRFITKTVDPQVSLVNGGDAGISIAYEVGSGKITLDDVNASGNGYVSLRGRLMSTGADGKVLVDDGFGAIDVVNNSASELVINDLDAGSQSTGVIRITDLNYRDGNNNTFSEWYIHEPGQQIKKYITSASATSYANAAATTVGFSENGQQTYSYQTKPGQLYYFVEYEEAERSLNWKMTNDGYIDGFFSTYQPLGDWQYDNPNNPNNAAWDVAYSGFTSCGSVSYVACNNDSTVSAYLTHVIDDRYKSQTTLYPYTTSYSKYYGGDFTKIKWKIHVPTYIAMKATTYVKADHPIKFQFIGSDTGSIDVQSKTGINLAGNINNSQGTTNLRTSTSGDITMADSGILNSGKTLLSAAGSLGTRSQALNVITDHISAVAGNGLVNLDLTAASGAISVEKLHASSSLLVNADKGLMPYGNGVHLKGDDINITSEFGGIGDVTGNQVMNLSSSGLVTMQATGDIALRQVSGDMAVNTIHSDAGDIWLTLDSGNLVNAIGQERYTDDELAYQAGVWDRLNLKSDDAGRGAVTAYENQVTGQYHSYWLIKQRLDDDSDNGFAINADYLDAFKLRYKSRQDAANGGNLDFDTIPTADVTAAVRAEYQAVSQWLLDEKAAGRLDPAYDLGSTYNSSYKFAIADNSELYNTLTQGARWSDSQLEITISAAALEPVTDAYISSRTANISGNNIRLDIDSGRVGEDLSDLTFAINRNSPALSDSQKAALLEAGPGDLTIVENSSTLDVRLKQQDPIKINADGLVAIDAGREIYIESDKALTLDRVSSSEDVRISAGGSISTNAMNNGATITANNLNLSTGSGSIGSEAAPVLLDIAGALRSVAAPGDIWLQHDGGLLLGAIGAGGHLNLDVNGNISNWSANGSNTHIIADSANLSAGGFDLGSSSRALKMKLGGGELKLEGDDAWLNVDSTTLVALGTVNLLGNLEFDSASRVDLGGVIHAAGITMQVDGDLSAQQNLAITGTGDIRLVANIVDLQKASMSGNNIYLEADSGAASFADISGQGGVSLLASGDMNLYGTVTAGQSLVVDAQSLTMNSGANIDANSSANLTTVSDMALRGIEVDGALSLTADHLNLNGNIEGKDFVDIDSTSVMTLAANQSLQTSGAVNIKAGSLKMLENSGVSAGSTLALDTGSMESQSNTGLRSSGQMSLNSFGVATYHNLTSDNGAIVVNSNNTLTLNGRLDAGTTATIAGQGETLNVNGGAVTTDDLAITGWGDIFLNSEISSKQGSVIINGQKSLFVNRRLLAGADIDLTLVGDLLLDEDQSIEAANTMLIDTAMVQMRSGSSLSANSLDLSAREQATLFTVDVTGNANITTGQDFTTNNTVSIGNSLTLDVEGDTTLNSSVTIGNNLVADLEGTLLAQSLVNVGNDVTLTVENDTTFKDTLTTTNGVLSVTSNGALSLEGDTSVAGLATFILADGFSLADGQTLAVGGDMRSTSQAVNFADNSQLNIGGQLAMTTREQATLFTVDVTDNANLTTGQNLTTNDTVKVGDTLSLDVEGNTTLNGSVTVANNLVADLEGTLLAQSSVRVGNDVTLTVENDATFKDTFATTNGLLSLDGNGALSLEGDTSVAGVATFNLADGFSLANGKILAVDGDMTSTSQAVSFADNSQLNIGGQLAITTREQATLFTIDVTGNANLTTGQNFTTNDTVTIGNTLSLDVEGNTTLNGSVTVANHLIADLEGSLLAQSPVSVGNDATLTVENDITFKDTFTTTNGLLSLDGNGALSLEGDTSVAGVATFNLADGFSLADGKILAVDGDMSSTSQSVSFANNSQLNVGGQLAMTTREQATLFTMDVTGNANLKTGQNLTINNTLTVGDILSLDVEGNTTLNGSVTVANNLVADLEGALLAQSSVSVGNDATLTVENDITFNSPLIVENGTLDISGNGHLLIDGDITAGQNMTVAVAESFAINGLRTVASGANIAIDARDLTMGSESSIVAAGSLTARTRGDQRWASLRVNSDLSSVSESGSIALTENVRVDGDTTLALSGLLGMAEAISLTTGNFTVGSEQQAGADSFVMGRDATLNATGRILIHTEGDQLLGQLTTNENQQAFFLKADAGALLGRSDLALNAGERHLTASQRVDCQASGNGCTGPQSYLQAATGIGDPLVVDLPWLSAETDSGDINIIASSDLHAKLLRSTNGNIYVTALESLEIDELIGTPWLMVDGLLFADRMTMDRGAMGSNERLEIDYLTLTDSGPLALFAPEIEATVDGGGAEDVLISAGGFQQSLSLNTDARSFYSALAESDFSPTQQATDVVVSLNNAGRMRFSDLNTQGGLLRTTGDLLIEQADVEAGLGRNLGIVTGFATPNELSLNLNNSNGTAIDVDGQFMTPAGTFWLSVADVAVTTNAQFTRYRQPLLLSYKSQLASSDTISTPESFYRLSGEYQNDLTNQIDGSSVVSISERTDALEQNLEQLLVINDDWFGNLPATATDGADNVWFTVSDDEDES